jgi:hypothetical protein
MKAVSTGVVVGCFALNVFVSNSYLYKRVCRTSTSVVRAVFVVSFALSASLFELCLWEINDSLDREYSLPKEKLTRIRAYAWNFILWPLLVDIILIIPLIASYSFCTYMLPRTPRARDLTCESHLRNESSPRPISTIHSLPLLFLPSRLRTSCPGRASRLASSQPLRDGRMRPPCGRHRNHINRPGKRFREYLCGMGDVLGST